MMKICSMCDQWAQWRARRPATKTVFDPVFDSKGKIKERIPKEITVWEFSHLLCGEHKKQQEGSGLKFDFAGAIPHGIKTY